MKKDPKLTKQEAQSASRIGKCLAERIGLMEMSEDDITEIITWATHAIDLDPEKYTAYRLKVYKTILKQNPAYAERLMDHFLREVMASEN